MKFSFRLVIVFLFASIQIFGQFVVFKENVKYGLKKSDSIILPAEYDSINLRQLHGYPDYWIACKANLKNVYKNSNGKLELTFKDQKIIYYTPSYGKLQILDASGNMRLFVNEKEITDFHGYRLFYEIPRRIHPSNSDVNTYEIKNDSILLDIKDKSNRAYYINYGKVQLPKQTSNAVLINNKNKLVEEFHREVENFEYLDTTIDYYLSTSYVILKKNRKYGIWDFVSEEKILPYKYAKITSYYNYVLLESKGLKTFYPNIGKIPKYKNIEPYIANFARFEYPSGKKGWVDRNGKEYFDGE